ncbi:MAG TPA: hypothetical protein VME44_20910 [Streptosporangiaceae bacterium]|nr:hypothetical protein [Streptosporangiaceae bacterium]
MSATTSTAAPPIAHRIGQEEKKLDKMIGVGMTLASFRIGPKATIRRADISLVAATICGEGLTGRVDEP